MTTRETKSGREYVAEYGNDDPPNGEFLSSPANDDHSSEVRRPRHVRTDAIHVAPSLVSAGGRRPRPGTVCLAIFVTSASLWQAMYVPSQEKVRRAGA